MQHASSFWITAVLALAAINVVAFATEDTAVVGLALLVVLGATGAGLWARASEPVATVGRGLVAAAALSFVGFAALYTWTALYMSGRL